MSEVTIPSSVTSIGNRAFFFCSKLSSVTIYAANPPACGEKGFYDYVDGGEFIISTLKIYVPSESINLYKTANGWSDYADRIYAIEE